MLIADHCQADDGEWVAALEQAGVPCGPINNLKQVFDDPQVQARGMRIELPHATAGKVPLIASPMRFSGTPVEHNDRPADCSASTRTRCSRKTLGKSADEIAQAEGGGDRLNPRHHCHPGQARPLLAECEPETSFL